MKELRVQAKDTNFDEKIKSIIQNKDFLILNPNDQTEEVNEIKEQNPPKTAKKAAKKGSNVLKDGAKTSKKDAKAPKTSKKSAKKDTTKQSVPKEEPKSTEETVPAQKISSTIKKKIQGKAFFMLKEGKPIEDTIKDCIDKFPKYSSKEIETIVRELYKEKSEFFGFFKKHINDQIIQYLSVYEPNLRRNSITKDYERVCETLSDADMNTALIDAQVFGIECSKDKFHTILSSNYLPTYNPFLEFFEQNKQRKPKGLIKALAESIISPIMVDKYGGNDDFNERFIKRWLVGLVASAFGGRSNLFLILVGGQGTGKSEFFLRLLPKELKRYLIETKLNNEKESDLAQKMGSALIIFDDEMSGKNKSDWKTLKSLSDQDKFRVRLPYDRLLASIKRLASFAGTSNDYEILGDLTGNRRLLPIEVISIVHDEYNAIDKTDLIMEAYHLYKEGYTHDLSTEDKEMLNRYTEKFQVTDPITEVIEDCLAVPLKENKEQIKQMTTTEIAILLNSYSPIKIYPNALGQRLIKFGFVQKHERRGKTTRRFYDVITLK